MNEPQVMEEKAFDSDSGTEDLPLRTIYKIKQASDENT